MKIAFRQWNVLFILLVTSLSVYGQKKMYWANKNPAQINVSNIDGTDTKTIVTQNLPQYHVLDYDNGKIYWTDKAKKAVIQCNLDGSNQVEFISGLINPKGIFIDSLSQFYIVDDNKILIYSKFGALMSTFIDNLKQPSDLIIYKGIVYWGNQEEHAIEYKPLVGGSKKVLVTNANKVSDIDIDTKANEIYYNSFDPNLSGIYKAGLDGKNIKQLTKDKTNGIALDSESETLYWGSNVFACIFKANLNNLNNPIRFVTERSNPFRIIINKKDNKFYFLDHNYGDFLFTANFTNGGYSSVVLASSDVYLPSRFEIDTINKKIYWVNYASGFYNDNSNAILSANLDGSGIKFLMKYPMVKTPHGIALDGKNQKIYWSDTETSTIHTMNLDGTAAQVILKDLMRPVGLKLDEVGKKIYWSDWGTKKIMTANLDGSNPKEVINVGTNISFGLDISTKQGKIFWTAQNEGSVYSANLDGSNIVKIVDTGSTFNRMDAIFIDENTSKIYFSDDKRIYQSDIDGSNLYILMANLSPSDVYILNDKSSGSQDLDSNIKLEVFPNPLINNINVRSSSTMNSIEIFEISGKSMTKELNINKEEHSINIESYNLNSGIYIMKIHTNDGNAIRKIFKL
jgi:sugar lactone lactonase YvrE